MLLNQRGYNIIAIVACHVVTVSWSSSLQRKSCRKHSRLCLYPFIFVFDTSTSWRFISFWRLLRCLHGKWVKKKPIKSSEEMQDVLSYCRIHQMEGLAQDRISFQIKGNWCFKEKCSKTSEQGNIKMNKFYFCKIY